MMDGKLTVGVYLRRNGSFYVVGSGDGAPIARGTVTVPLLVEPESANLKRWLAGMVPAP